MISSKNIVIKKSTLRDYFVVDKPGTYKLPVASTVKPEYIIEDGDKSRYVVKLRAGTTKNLIHAVQLFGLKEYISYDKVRDSFFKGAIWADSITDLDLLPVKGEEVIANFDYVNDVLRCNSITLIPRKTSNKFDLDLHCNSRNMLKKLISLEI